MTMTSFTGMLSFQLLAEVVMVMVMVISHSPVVSRLTCKLIMRIYLNYLQKYSIFLYAARP